MKGRAHPPAGAPVDRLRRSALLLAPACWATGTLPAPARAATAAAGPATALLIGNAAYREAPLRRAAGDAQAVASALRGLAFDVRVGQDLDWESMVDAMSNLVRRAQDSPLRLFYFAGHGLQAHGRNYLHPVGPPPAHERQLRSHAIDLDEWLERLGRIPHGVSIVIIDACRSEALARALPPTRSARSAGLAPVPEPVPRGMVVAFSTGPSSRAADDGGHGHSPYTRRLLEALHGPAMTLEAMFKRVHTAVEQDTAGAQRPWLSTSLVGELCLQPPATTSPAAGDSVGLCGRPGAAAAARRR